MRRLALALLALVTLGACAPDAATQEREARTFVYQKLSTPDLPALVGPVVLQANFAVVDWTRGAFSGGRTLLRREKTGWVLALCGGAQLRQRPTLERAGVPDGAAGVLATKLLREEGRISSDRRAQLDKWKSLGPAVNCPEVKAGS